MSGFKVVLSLTLIAWHLACLSEGGCPNGFVNVEGRCLKVLTEQLTAEEAHKKCGEADANLAIVDTEAFFEKMSKYLVDYYKVNCYSNTKNSIGFWSAGRRQGSSNVFYWKLFKPSRFVNPQCECGNVVGLKRWAVRQPDNANNDEDCMELYVGGQPTDPFVFNDISCTGHKMCALCQTDET